MTSISLPDPVVRRPGRPDVDAAALERTLRERIDGVVRFDAGSRGTYSTDASTSERMPPERNRARRQARQSAVRSFTGAGGAMPRSSR